MPKIWYTSDLHFYHTNICLHTDRKKVVPQEDHDIWLIDLWNSQVSKHDLVYQLGDFVFNCRNLETWQSVVSRLNGRIIHIKGNHDSSDVLKRSGHEWYDLKRVKVGKQHIVLCHFALRVWDMYHHGAWHLYGHSHGNLPSAGRSIDVGIDNAYNVFGEHRFFTMDDLRELIGSKDVILHDHHKLKE